MPNPYLPLWEYIPDGEPRVFGNRVYVYGSHDRVGHDQFCDYVLKCWSAPVDDLGHWTDHGVIFRTRDTFDHPADTDWTKEHNELYAPDVVEKDGKYYLFAYIIGAKGCVAVSDRPEGPFVDRGVVLMANEIGVHNSIDQFYIRDNGKNYLIWGSFFGIYMIQLTEDGLRIMPGAQKVQIAGSLMEASYVYKRDGYYYLFGSAGSCCEGANSTYRVVYGRSTSLAGPYVNKSGGRMLDNQCEILLQSNDFVAGPGHNAEFVEDDNGDTWIPYHGYLRANADLGRVVLLDKVQWKDGWPFIENSSPSSSSAAPYFIE